MKRILVLCMAMILILSGIANAEIKKTRDETGMSVYSIIEEIAGSNVTWKFSKNVVGEEVFYRVSVAIESNYPEWVLADQPISLRIDKYPKFYLDKYHYETRGSEYATIEAEVPPEIITRLSKAKDAFLSSKDRRGIGMDMVSRDFLAEWQEVINTTE